MQATDMYKAALQRAPSDQGSKEGLAAVNTVSANLDAGKASLFYIFGNLPGLAFSPGDCQLLQ